MHLSEWLKQTQQKPDVVKCWPHTSRYLPQRKEDTYLYKNLCVNVYSSLRVTAKNNAAAHRLANGCKLMVRLSSGIGLRMERNRPAEQSATGVNLRLMLSFKKPSWKGTILWNSTYMTFRKRQSYRDRKHGHCQELGRGQIGHRGPRRSFWGCWKCCKPWPWWRLRDWRHLPELWSSMPKRMTFTAYRLYFNKSGFRKGVKILNWSF